MQIFNICPRPIRITWQMQMWCLAVSMLCCLKSIVADLIVGMEDLELLCRCRRRFNLLKSRIATISVRMICYFRGVYYQGKTWATTKGQNRFIIFHTFSHFFIIFPPGLSPSKQRVLAQGEQKRKKNNKKNWTNRFCTLVVARLSSSYIRHRPPEPHRRIHLALPSSGVDLANRFNIDSTSIS